MGAAGENGVIVLAFGKPAYQSGYGTNIPGGMNQFMPIADIQTLAQNFATGFYSCASGSAFATIVVGTTNECCSTNWDHGNAWTEMVNSFASWITAPPSYASRVAAAGGSDIELGFNTYTPSRDWVLGFDTGNTRNMYNFGDAQGCPFQRLSTNPSNPGYHQTGQTSTSLACDNGWNQSRVRYVSWGNSAAYPIPIIYSNPAAVGDPYSANAVQWQRLSNYSRLATGSKIVFSGIITQSGACADVGCGSDEDNTPNQGYDQIWNALNYLDSGVVAHTPQWLTDIDWQD